MNVNYSGTSESSVPLDSLDKKESGEENLAFGPNDVLSGRNKLSFNHIGNRRFREIVAQSIDDYNTAQSRSEKYGIVETIMSHIAKSGGRFLKQVDDGSWQELDVETVRQKIAHAIRDTTKKREAKLKKASQRENVATKMAKRALSPPATVTPAATASRESREPSRQGPISTFVQDLNKFMQKKRGASPGPPITSSGVSPPTGQKNHKQQAARKPKPPPPRQGLGLDIQMLHPVRNELRPDPGQEMRPGTGLELRTAIGHEMRRDLGHRLRPAFEPSSGQMDRAATASPLDLEERPGLHMPGMRLGLAGEMPPRRNSFPTEFRGTRDPGLGHHSDHEFHSDYDMVAASSMGQHLAHQELEDDLPVAHDDEFMAKIDDTLGHWQPEPDPHFH